METAIIKLVGFQFQSRPMKCSFNYTDEGGEVTWKIVLTFIENNPELLIIS